MNGLFGWVGREMPAEAARDTAQRMAGPLRRTGRPEPEIFVADGAALGTTTVRRSSLGCRHRGYLAIVLGRPSFRDAHVGASHSPGDFVRAVVDAFIESGAETARRLRGGFALAIVAEDGRRALLATDRIGGRFPIAYKQVDGGVVFGSRSDCIRFHPDGASDIDPQAVFDYLYFNVVPAPQSARKDVRYLPAAHVLEYRNDTLDVHAYWKAVYREDERADLHELSREFRDGIHRAVSRCCVDASTLGSFLSGGIDSSTLAGAVREVTGSPAKTFSIGFDAEGFDEMSYARIAVGHFGAEHNEYYVTPEDVINVLPELVSAYAEPFGNASAIPVHCCARLARENGVDTMLGGDGGDELFAGNKRYATQQVFGIYERVPRWLRGSVIEPIAEKSGWLDVLPPVRKARRYVEQARVPMPDRLETYNQLERYGVERVLERDYLALVDPSRPSMQLRDVYNAADAGSMLNRMLALDMKFTIADSDLPKVTVMSELAGIEVEYPFLDDDVVEFSFRVPTRWKLRHWKLRWFVKQALAGYLPDAILEKEKHGFGLPFGVWMREHTRLREFALDHLQVLKGRRVVQDRFVDELIRRHEREHATYYGVMMWVLLVLELWFERNA